LFFERVSHNCESLKSDIKFDPKSIQLVLVSVYGCS